MDADVNIFDHNAWVERAGGKILLYFGPHLHENLQVQQVDGLLRSKNAYGAFWNYDWDCGVEGPWYSIVCDIPNYDLDRIPSRSVRYKVRRCLKACTVRRIEISWLAEMGYKTYLAATTRYRNYRRQSPRAFKRDWDLRGRDPGADAYGVFLDERLIAYGIAHRRGRSIRLGPMKFDPEYSKASPMFGLYYTMACEYLRHGAYDYVDNGSRPLMHQTHIVEFLEHMGWRRAYCRLGLYLRRPLRWGLAVARGVRVPCHLVLPERYVRMIEGCLAAEQIANETTGRA